MKTENNRGQKTIKREKYKGKTFNELFSIFRDITCLKAHPPPQKKNLFIIIFIIRDNINSFF